MKIALQLAVGALAAIVGLAGFWLLRDPAPHATEPQVSGPTANDATRLYVLNLKDAQGKTHPLNQWRGRILIVNYWATWCHPCKEEMPGFSRLNDKYAANGIQFIGISIDSDDKIIDFQKTTPVSYPLLIGDMGTMAQSAEFGNSHQGLPFTAVFNRHGELVMTKLGRWSEADLEPRLRQLLGS